jgi:hypothetical protein
MSYPNSTQVTSELILRQRELAALVDLIAEAREELRRVEAAVAAGRWAIDQRVADERASLARRRERLVRFWRRLRARRAGVERECAERIARLSEQIEADRARLELRRAGLERSERRLERRAAAFARRVKQLAALETQALGRTRQLVMLKDEVVSLEARIANQRESLARDVPAASAGVGLPPDLTRPISQLADLRARLIEQARLFLEAVGAWEGRREQAVQWIDAAAARLDHRERDVAAREHALENRQARALARDRRVAAREANLHRLLREWSLRIDDETARLSDARHDAEDARDSWLELLTNVRERESALRRREAAVAAREIAVEKFRRECIDVADRPITAARRIDRIRCDWLRRLASESRFAEEDGAALAAQSVRLDERERRLLDRERDNEERRRELLLLEADLDRRIALHEAHSAGSVAVAGGMAAARAA